MSFVTQFAVLLPFGDRLLKYLKDPFNFEKLGAIAANIIAERTKAAGNSKVHVSVCKRSYHCVNFKVHGYKAYMFTCFRQKPFNEH